MGHEDGDCKMRYVAPAWRSWWRLLMAGCCLGCWIRVVNVETVDRVEADVEVATTQAPWHLAHPYQHPFGARPAPSQNTGHSLGHDPNATAGSSGLAAARAAERMSMRTNSASNAQGVEGWVRG